MDYVSLLASVATRWELTSWPRHFGCWFHSSAPFRCKFLVEMTAGRAWHLLLRWTSFRVLKRVLPQVARTKTRAYSWDGELTELWLECSSYWKSIEDCKPEEALEFLSGWWKRPKFNSFQHPLFHLNAFYTDHVTKELGGALVEWTLLSLEVEVVLPQLGKHELNVVAMFSLIPGLHQDVISVDQDKAMEVILEDLVYKCLEHGRGSY